MLRNMEMHEHRFSGRIPAEIAENLKEFFPEHDDLSYEEVLMQQESVYLSFQANGRNRDMTSDNGHISEVEGESSSGGSAKSHLDLDQALAMSLQELEGAFDTIYISEHSGTTVGSTELSPIETPVRAISQEWRQDDIDPDNMTYEQLQSLDETNGIENKGLSEDLISQLPTFKYKGSIFSKKKRKEECVICCMTYNSGERLIILPCAHQYHSKCIKTWLNLKKHCPVCQKEVQDEG